MKKNDIRSIETIHYFTKHNIAIIGRLTDTDYYRKLRFCDVLSEKGWTKAINIQWLQNIASHHQWVYVASPLNIKNIFTMDDQNNNITFFAVELSFLIKSGYKILGNWLIPVKPYEPVINATG
ncbi:hypothetical protein [Endozoicomonas sp. Mp262]|uniref:hypothetical protein n=1 Tax=Endozoicomonas sp. Mp262 TaxID=2919499 RepID=UPI0021DA37FF